ncbi:MAG: hypothetical protein IKJ83_04890 [Ruminococcus sp.]|nr:hypothetical protein [Ruminococcus sp.]
MKKYLAFFLVLLMAVSVLAACGKDDSNNDSDKVTATAPVQIPDITEPVATEDNGNTLTSTEQVTVIDNELCTLTIDGLEYDELWGYNIKTSLVNKTSDKSLVASLESISVRNVQFDAIYYCEAAAGKTAKENISLVTSDEEAEIIGDKPVFTLSFEVNDADDYLSDALGEMKVTYFPFGGVEAGFYEREPLPSDKVLVDNDALSVTVTAIEDDDFMGYTLKLFIQNKTDKELMVSAEDVSVNGIMADPYFAKAVAGGLSSFAQMCWLDSDFEELEITEVQDIELTLRAYDYDDIFAGDVVKEKVTITP